MKRFFRLKSLWALMLMMFLATSAFATPWKFGVMSDTQWIGTDDGRSPNSVPVDIIKKINQEFIGKGVQFVIQVGDLCDNGSIAGEDTRAAFSQELFNAGIGFFPFRGNHDSSKAAGIEFQRIYPQTQNGLMNSIPANVFTVSNPDAAVQPFPTVSGSPFTMGTNFSSPVTVAGTADNSLKGLTYSFDFNNARFVMLDGQAAAGTDGVMPGIDPQQSWITTQLSGKPANTHAFVFSHKGLITENHVDVLFGADPSKDPAGQNAFISSLMNNGVRYYMQGHDHMHDRSIIASPDGTSAVQNILCASNSSKFYTPGVPSNDDKYNVPVFGHGRQTQIAQELHTVGYYICTVDGPRVTVDYYSAVPANVAPVGGVNGPNVEWLLPTTPALTFVKAETFGYGLNGHEYLVAQGAPYTSLNETYGSTTARILSGSNGSTAKDFDNRTFTKTVDTGWTDKSAGLASDILSIWGMADLYAPQTDTFALSLSYDPSVVTAAQIQSGNFALATKDASGNWVNAVAKNVGGTMNFVNGPYNASYTLGTYGVDTAAHTVWAVINHNSDYAATQVKTAAITAAAAANGSISAPGAVTYQVGTSPSYTITPNAGYHVDSLVVDGTKLAGATSYTFTNLAAGSHYINAYFAPNAQVKIQSAAAANGNISPNGANLYLQGTSPSFTITPNAGYHVASLVVDGATLPAATSYTFTNVAGTYHSISAYFAQDPQPMVKIAAAAGTNGSINPAGSALYVAGTRPSFTITPNAGYKVSNLVVDGTTLPGATSYTFSSVSGTYHYINAYFTAQ